MWEIELPDGCSNEQYEQAMQGLFERCRKEKAEAMAFGDLFLEDVGLDKLSVVLIKILTRSNYRCRPGWEALSDHISSRADVAISAR